MCSYVSHTYPFCGFYRWFFTKNNAHDPVPYYSLSGGDRTARIGERRLPFELSWKRCRSIKSIYYIYFLLLIFSGWIFVNKVRSVYFVRLQEQLLRGKIRSGEMTTISTSLITSVVRSFLLSLTEPLVTYTARESFIKLVYMKDEVDVQVKIVNQSSVRMIYWLFSLLWLDVCLFPDSWTPPT